MPIVFLALTASHFRLTPQPCGYASLAIILRYLAKRSQFGHFQVVESSLSRNPPTYTHDDECTLLNSITLGPGETRACSQTSRTNNKTLTISTPLRVTQMRGLRNLYLSFPPSLYGWRLFISTLSEWHWFISTLLGWRTFISNLLGWRICLAYATPGQPPCRGIRACRYNGDGLASFSVYMAMASPHRPMSLTHQ